MKQSLKSLMFLLFFLVLIFFNFSFLIIEFKNDFKPYFNTILTRQSPKKHVFIDLGVGKGDATYNFFQNEIKSPAISSLLLNDENKNVNTIKWDVYLVEANPVFDADLLAIKRDLTKLNHSVHVLNQTAAWTYDGIVPFYLDTNEANNFWNLSLEFLKI